MPIRDLNESMNSMQESDVIPQDLPSMAQARYEEHPPENKASFSDLFAAHWGMETSVGSLFTNGLQDTEVIDPNFNPAKELQGTPYWQFADEALYADNQQELNDWKRQKDREIAQYQTMANAGWTGTGAMFAAQMTDPINIIPWFRAAKYVKGAATATKFIAGGATMGAATMAAQEAVLQSTQTGRTAEQSAYNIGAGAVFGTILGGAISAAKLSRDSLATNIVEQLLKGEELPKIQVTPRSAGAAEIGLEDASLARMKVNFFGKDFDLSNLLQIPGLKAPVIEGLTADSRVLNTITSSMFEHSNLETRNLVQKPDGIILQDAKDSLGPYPTVTSAKIISRDTKAGKAEVALEYTEKDVNGKTVGEPKSKTVSVDLERPGSETPVAMETFMKLDRAAIYEYQKELSGIYLEYTGTKPGAFEAARAWKGARDEGKMSYREMLNDAASAARRGDAHENPYVRRMAEAMRKRIDEVNAQMKKAGVPLPEFKLVGRQSYFPIVYDKQAILNDRYGFEKVIEDYYHGKGLGRAEARSAAIEYADNVIGAGSDAALLSDITRMSLDKGVKFTKERVSDVPDTLMEKYLVNDPLHVISQYMAQGSQLSRFYDMLHTHGVNTLNDLKLKLHAEYEEKQALLNKKDVNYNYNKEQLTNKYVAYQNRLQDFASIMLGQYSKRTAADSALRALRTYNYLRLMGMITLSSITDLAMPIFKHGLGRTLMQGYVRGLTNISSGLRGLETDMLKHIGVAVEQELDGALRTMIDPEFGSNFVQRAASTGKGLGPMTKKLYNDFIYGANIAGDAASNAFSKAALINYWNIFGKRLGARIAISRIIGDLRKYASLPAPEKEYLNSIGIGSKHVDSILSQFDKYGGADKGGYITDIKSWSNIDAKERFSAAVIKEADSTIVTPGRGDIPRFIQGSELARTIFQFKGFFSAMTTKFLISGMQRRDMAAATGLAAMIALGAAQYIIRTKISGKEPDMSTNNLMLEGINRSGAPGLIGDPIFGLMLSQKLGGGSRYLNQNWIEYMVGPSGSLVKKLGEIYQDVRDKKGVDALKKDIAPIIPFQNLLGIRQLYDKANK